MTFDTGGISIKPAGGMEDMKWDMAGAGTVIGLMAALAGRKARSTRSASSGWWRTCRPATRSGPGDVVKSYSGQTIEVINTDAEGRLVLADVIWYCQRSFEPKFMIDLATLTGAIIVALGHEHAGLFSNDDALAEKLLGGREGDRRDASGACRWARPTTSRSQSDIADMKNVGGRPGGSITAAQFIQRFVNGKPWAHLDIAGMAWSTKDTRRRAEGRHRLRRAPARPPGRGELRRLMTRDRVLSSDALDAGPGAAAAFDTHIGGRAARPGAWT